MTPPAYAELVAASNFSFLRGASHPKTLVLTSLLLGQAGLGLADRNTVAGVVRAWSALKQLREDGWSPPEKLRDGGSPGEIRWQEDPLNDPALVDQVRERAGAFRLLTGTRLGFADGTPDIVAYPEDREGWGRLTRLLTLGNRRAIKGDCHLHLGDLLANPEGLLLVVMPERSRDGLPALLDRLNEVRPGAVWLGATMPRRGDDRRRLARLAEIGAGACTPLLATNDVLYHAPSERDLQDVLTSLREGTSIDQAGRRLLANAERHLKSPAEMARLFAYAPHALAEAMELLKRPVFDLSELRYQYPEEPIPPGRTPQAWLEQLVGDRLPLRYPDGVPDKVRATLAKELAYIRERDLAPYFLTIHDIVREADNRRILCQGRGSAANSAVCFVLGITSVDPAHHDLLFERFGRPQRTSRHRRRFRARASGRDHPVHLWALRPRAGGHCRHRDPLSPAQRHPRGRQGAGPDRGCHRPPRLQPVGQLGIRNPGPRCAAGGPRSGQSDDPSRGCHGRAHPGLPPTSVAACRRLHLDARAAG